MYRATKAWLFKSRLCKTMKSLFIWSTRTWISVSGNLKGQMYRKSPQTTFFSLPSGKMTVFLTGGCPSFIIRHWDIKQAHPGKGLPAPSSIAVGEAWVAAALRRVLTSPAGNVALAESEEVLVSHRSVRVPQLKSFTIHNKICPT